MEKLKLSPLATQVPLANISTLQSISEITLNHSYFFMYIFVYKINKNKSQNLGCRTGSKKMPLSGFHSAIINVL